MQNEHSAEPTGTASETVDAAKKDLLDTIADYRAGCVDFNTNAQPGCERDSAKATYERPLRALLGWTDGARSYAEAVAALQLAREEALDVFKGELITPMLVAGLSFFEARDCPVGVAPSPDIAFAVSAIDFFESQEAELDGRIREYDAVLFSRFDKDVEAWAKWCEDTDHPYLTEQIDSLTRVIGELKTFVRVRECRTIGDLLAKLRLDEDWARLPKDRVSADYADYAAELVRSILPLSRRMSTAPEQQSDIAANMIVC